MGGAGMSGQSAPERIAAAVERLYRRDPRRFGKLVVWVRTAAKRTYHPQDIAAALERLEEMEGRGIGPEPWWPYMVRMLQGIWRRRALAEHETYKRDAPNAMKAVLREVLHRLENR